LLARARPPHDKEIWQLPATELVNSMRNAAGV
jgi:hypothetical protein